MKYSHFLGIDPGATGGIAVVSHHPHIIPVAHKMPETERDLFDLLIDIKGDGNPLIACVELVHSMPGQGVSSSFKFGQNFGAIRMAVIAAKIPHEFITPQKWQKAIGCMTGGDKNVSKAKAQQLFPDNRITHAVADALLIAEYCRRTHGQTA